MIRYFKKSTSVPYVELRKKILLSIYGAGLLMLIIMVILVLTKLTDSKPIVMIAIPLIITVIGVVFGAFISVVLDLPNISIHFDKIKNEVASKEILGVEKFSSKVVEMICSYFTFSFFNVEYAYMKVVGYDHVYSSNDILMNIDRNVFTDCYDKSKLTSEPFFVGDEVIISNKKLAHYAVPIIFGDKYLGFFGVFTSNKLLPIFLSVLNSFEDEYLDDQLVHVLEYEKRVELKDFLREVDVFSNKITQGEYKSVLEYKQEVITYLVNRVSCKGGIFISKYGNDVACHFKGQKMNNIVTYFKKYIERSDLGAFPRIFTDPNMMDYRYILELPIVIEHMSGAIFLFDEVVEGFQHHIDTLAEVENIKLDNDLDNLAALLSLNLTH